MTIESHHITVSDVDVEVVRKDIKNLHLGVYPPNGRVRVAAPLILSDEAVRLAVIEKLAWIKRQQTKFVEQPRQSQREMVNGESHYFQGQRYRLRVYEEDCPPRVALHSIAYLDLVIRLGSSAEQREAVLLRWYREQLKLLVPPLMGKWQPLFGVEVAAWGIKKMKTKWGTCNREARRIWLNLELAKKPVHCLEFILVHEMVHLLERHHNERFTALMDRFMPQWRLCRDELNQSVLGHDEWTY